MRVTRQSEDGYFFHIAEQIIRPRLVQQGGLKGVDAVTGATVSSEAMIDAVAQAMGQARR